MTWQWLLIHGPERASILVLELEFQVRLRDVPEWNAHCARAFHVERYTVIGDGGEHAAEISARRLSERTKSLELDRLTFGAAEVVGLPQPAVETRAGHLQVVCVLDHVLDVEERLDRMRHRLAVLEADASRLVDEQSQDPAVAFVQKLHVHQLHTQAGDDRFGELCSSRFDGLLVASLRHRRPKTRKAGTNGPLFEGNRKMYLLCVPYASRKSKGMDGRRAGALRYGSGVAI